MNIPFVYPYGTDDFVGEIRMYNLFQLYNDWLLGMVSESESHKNMVISVANMLLRELEYIEFLLETERDEWDCDTIIKYESELNVIRKTLKAYYVPSIHILS